MGKRDKLLPLHQRSLLLGVGILVAACSGVIGDPDPPKTRARGAVPNNSQSPSAIAAGAVPLARLTSAQYKNTLRDLFAPIELPEVAPPKDTTVGGYQGNRAAQTPSPVLIESYLTSARLVASTAVAQRDAFLGCTPSARAQEDECLKAFVTKFGKRAYRRPLTTEETDALVAFYTSARTSGSDFTAGVELVVKVMLLSPHFLYRVEIGTPIEGTTAVRLGSYEMASRLSYLFWNSMPDDSLFAAAEAGELESPEGVDRHARRLLTDPRTRVGVSEFFGQWLRFDTMADMQKDATMYPGFGSETSLAMRQSADKFVENVFFGTGSFKTLLTSDEAWVNDTLATFYGVASPGSAELKLVKVDAAQRSGILTNVGTMAAFAHATTDAPVLRGVFVLDRLLCAAPPPPPPNIPAAPVAAAGDAKTTRQRFEQQHESGPCATCHKVIDPVGFAFSNYDAVGRYRTTENGQPVDATGTFTNMGDLEGSFNGAVEMARKLAESRTVQSCVASQWARYALGVDAAGVERERMQPVVDAFVASNFDMRELAVALVKSEVFRTREVVR